MSYLPCIEVATQQTVDSTVIWLHGLGANGHDFEPVVPELKLPEKYAVRFIFPNAPQIPVTVNTGYVMPAWYDILSEQIEQNVDEKRLLISATAISKLVDREIQQGIDSRRIVIAGFSQGGAVAYQTALTYPKPLAGMLAISTYFATSCSIKPSLENQQLPICILHGTTDPVVPEFLARQSRDHLLKMGHTVDYSTFPIGHSVCSEEIDHISYWLQTILS